MKHSVIIPCYNAADTIGAQLEALACQNWQGDWELIVADNGSTDRSREVVRSYADRLPKLRLVDASTRRGCAYARNFGARAATGQALLFCDADDEVGSGWLGAMADALERHEFVASRMDTEKLSGTDGQRYTDNPLSQGLINLPIPPYLPFASTSGLGIRRSRHDLVGGFDEAYRRASDREYCVRVQLSGAELRFVPEATVHYRRRRTWGGIVYQGLWWGYYSVLIYHRYCAEEQRLPGGWHRHTIALLRVLARPPLSVRAGPRSRARWLFQSLWHVGVLLAAVRARRAPPPP